MMTYKVSSPKNVRRIFDASDGRFSKTDDNNGPENGAPPALQRTATLTVLSTKNRMSWAECIFQLFFSIQGPAFFVLPGGFKDVGYLFGIVGSFGISFFYLYMIQTYLWCERKVRKRRNMADHEFMSLYSLVEFVFVDTEQQKRIGYWLNVYLKYEIILSWSFSLSFALLFACSNIKLILGQYGYAVADRMILFTLFPLTTLLSWIPNLKVMSCIAYFCTLMFVVIMLEIIYYVMTDVTYVPKIQMIGDMSMLSTFLATVFFTIVSTPLVFPLKNEMKRPAEFGSACGSFNSAIVIVILLNVAFSLCGYIKYGSKTADNILENLPSSRLMIVSNCVLTAAMICCGAISFFVVFETIWEGSLKALCSKSRYVKLYEYAARTFINLFITIVPLAVPSLDVFINMISCFSYPFDSIFLPVILHTMLLWKDEKLNNMSIVFILALNSALVVVSIGFSIVTFVVCVREIINLYRF